jgi:hypothetical protein
VRLLRGAKTEAGRLLRSSLRFSGADASAPTRVFFFAGGDARSRCASATEATELLSARSEIYDCRRRASLFASGDGAKTEPKKTDCARLLLRSRLRAPTRDIYDCRKKPKKKKEFGRFGSAVGRACAHRSNRLRASSSSVALARTDPRYLRLSKGVRSLRSR